MAAWGTIGYGHKLFPYMELYIQSDKSIKLKLEFLFEKLN